MKLVIEMSLDNAAFYDNEPGEEVKRAVDAAIDRLDFDRDEDREPIIDFNGNRVGEVVISDE